MREVKPIEFSIIAENEAVTAMRPKTSKKKVQRRELPLQVHIYILGTDTCNVLKTWGTGYGGCEVRSETLAHDYSHSTPDRKPPLKRQRNYSIFSQSSLDK